MIKITFRGKDNKTIKIKTIIDSGATANFISSEVTKYIIYKTAQTFCFIIKNMNKKIMVLALSIMAKEIEIACLLFLDKERCLFREIPLQTAKIILNLFFLNNSIWR